MPVTLLTKYSYFTAGPLCLRLAIIALMLLFSGCASFGHKQSVLPSAMYVATGNTELARYAPVIMHENDTESFNQVGTPVVTTGKNGNPRVRIDSTIPTIYADKHAFTSVNGKELSNYVYRMHFEKVPFSVIPFHVTAGRNSGLFFITTVNQRGQPLLYTTVHTCGCYLAFVPTQYMPASAYPDNWPDDSQRVFGEKLPTSIELTDENHGPVLTLRDGTHRVANFESDSLETMQRSRLVVHAPLRPLKSLQQLPSEHGPVSMFQTRGLREGYVRNIFKPFEFLLISWWAFDLNVGVDKMYGDADVTGTRFYTSLKPWARKKSDMWQFGGFLDYWGWKL